MEKLDPSLVDNPLIFPDATILANTFDFMPLTRPVNKQYERDLRRDRRLRADRAPPDDRSASDDGTATESSPRSSPPSPRSTTST